MDTKLNDTGIEISIVTPVYNEELLIEKLFERTIRSMEKIGSSFEIICIDDGSADKTLELLIEHHKKDKRFKVVSLSRNFGHQSAILAGLNQASGKYIGIMDGDLQDPPEVFEKFLEKLKSEDLDVVYAVRKKRKESFIKRFAYWFYYRLLFLVSAESIPLDSGDFCIMTERVKDHIISHPEQSLFIRGIRHWVGFKQAGMEYERAGRTIGETKYSLAKLMRLAYDGIFSFSNFPIKFLGRLGFLSISFSVIYGIILFIKRIFGGPVPQGYTSLILTVIFFGGIQLISIRIIGEYITRIYDESRNRPLFIIKDKFLD